MPCMSEMAGRGVVFNRAFSASNLCAPARTAVLTGRHPNKLGFYENADVEANGMPAGSGLADRLRQAGYATALIGKYHCGTRDAALRQRVLDRHQVTLAALNSMEDKERKQRIEAEIRSTGYFGSVIPAHHPQRYGFNRYFGYNHYECFFYGAENVWDGDRHAGKIEGYNSEVFTQKALEFSGRCPNVRFSWKF